MRAYLRVAPTWILAVVQDLLVLPVYLAFAHLLDHEKWTQALAGAAFVTVFAGIVEYFTERRSRLRTSYLLAPFTGPARREVIHAAHRGLVPKDPAMCQAAIALAELHLERATRGRVLGIVLLLALLALAAAYALTDSAWYWLAVAAMLEIVIEMLRQPRRMRRRIAVLTGG